MAEVMELRFQGEIASAGLDSWYIFPLLCLIYIVSPLSPFYESSKIMRLETFDLSPPAQFQLDWCI